MWFDVRVTEDKPPALRHLSGLTDYFTDQVLAQVGLLLLCSPLLCSVLLCAVPYPACYSAHSSVGL